MLRIENDLRCNSLLAIISNIYKQYSPFIKVNRKQINLPSCRARTKAPSTNLNPNVWPCFNWNCIFSIFVPNSIHEFNSSLGSLSDNRSTAFCWTLFIISINSFQRRPLKQFFSQQKPKKKIKYYFVNSPQGNYIILILSFIWLLLNYKNRTYKSSVKISNLIKLITSRSTHDEVFGNKIDHATIVVYF